MLNPPVNSGKDVRIAICHRDTPSAFHRLAWLAFPCHLPFTWAALHKVRGAMKDMTCSNRWPTKHFAGPPVVGFTSFAWLNASNVRASSQSSIAVSPNRFFAVESAPRSNNRRTTDE
jgi:hypothetical protein